MIKVINKTGTILLMAAFFVSSCVTNSGEAEIKLDSHYTSAGFFDLHVCNWPDQPLFFLAVFSTISFNKIESITVYRPDGSRLDSFNLGSFKTRTLKNNKKKQIYIDRFLTGTNEKDGWYRAVIKLANGETIIAKDYIKIKKMPMARLVTPANSLDEIQIPEKFLWQGIPEARYYKITIKDEWENGKIIHTSPLLQHSEYKIPEGLIKPGGWYTWAIHARDVHEDLLLGDFNHGSLTQPATFSVAR